MSAQSPDFRRKHSLLGFLGLAALCLPFMGIVAPPPFRIDQRPTATPYEGTLPASPFPYHVSPKVYYEGWMANFERPTLFSTSFEIPDPLPEMDFRTKVLVRTGNAAIHLLNDLFIRRR